MLGVSWFLAILALVVMGAMGAYALVNPRWAARFMRLREDPERPGGFAEFRATYGGLFFGTHAAALALIALYLRGGSDVIGLSAGGAVFVLGAGYAGSALGRAISMLRDGARTGFNIGSTFFELGAALCLWAPWIAGLWGGMR
jgi:hypothetical protein